MFQIKSERIIANVVYRARISFGIVIFGDVEHIIHGKCKIS